jgi:CheY-like chemotaxis protein
VTSGGDAAATDRWRLLVVEDNVGHARLLRSILEALPVETEVHQAGRVAAGVERLAVEPFDAILSDLHLPDGQGAAVVSRLLSGNRSIPLIAVTALDDEELVNAVMARGAVDCIRKDRLTVELVDHVLHRAIQRGRSGGLPAVLLDETGLYNAEGTDVAARRVLAFARRQRHPVTFLHLFLKGGEAELEAMARLAAAIVRDADLVGRIAPDHLCLVLPDDRSDPPAVLGRLEAKRAASAAASLEVRTEVRRFDPNDPADLADLVHVEVPDDGDTGQPAEPQRRALLATTDDALVAMVAEALGAGWSVMPAASPAQAIRVVALDEPSVILVDAGFPEPGPLALVRLVREQPESVELPVIGLDHGVSSAGVENYRDGFAARIPRHRIGAELLTTIGWSTPGQK